MSDNTAEGMLNLMSDNNMSSC